MNEEEVKRFNSLALMAWNRGLVKSTRNITISERISGDCEIVKCYIIEVWTGEEWEEIYNDSHCYSEEALNYLERLIENSD
jgi:hypothetical protein